MDDDRFNSAYTFSNLYSFSIFEKCFRKSERTPKYVVLLHIAVAFKVTTCECEDALKLFGYLPLHAKNIFHLAVYTILKEMEGNSDTSSSDFKQFDRLKRIYLSELRRSQPLILADAIAPCIDRSCDFRNEIRCQ